MNAAGAAFWTVVCGTSVLVLGVMFLHAVGLYAKGRQDEERSAGLRVLDRRNALRFDSERRQAGVVQLRPAPLTNIRQDVPLDVRWRVFARDNYTCQNPACQCRPQDTANHGCELTIDHIYPVALGGTNDLSNLQTLCRQCNSAKGARIVEWPQ